ncbi:Transcription factor GTE9 [Camellia lanceoleosa]|uniref:Transcription factor GTE9 n=1 Tax=Camellia lanceoleosa TaxID=1840588 RepID=A0ACC0I4C0_9ERIC|nr:Transcription factor GTE9 [Camellia lanceoleosa]
MQRTNVVALLPSSDVLSCSNTQNGPSIEKVNPAGDSGTSGRFESASQASAPSTLNAILIEHSEALLIGYSAENFKKSEGLTSGPGKKGCKRRGWNRGTSGRWKVIANKLPKDSQPLLEKSDIQEEKGTIKPMPPSKKRKLTSPQHKAMPGRAKRIMTYEEKPREDEIEVYIDDLSDNTLFMLQKLLDDYLREIRKNQAKAKPCEIEVLNGSWLSDLSMQFLCKGY